MQSATEQASGNSTMICHGDRGDGGEAPGSRNAVQIQQKKSTHQAYHTENRT